MPIRRYVEHGVIFTPQTLSKMSEAFTAAVETLEIGADEIKRQAVAQFIIRLAREDGEFDATALRDRAVAAFRDERRNLSGGKELIPIGSGSERRPGLEDSPSLAAGVSQTVSSAGGSALAAARRNPRRREGSRVTVCRSARKNGSDCRMDRSRPSPASPTASFRDRGACSDRPWR